MVILGRLYVIMAIVLWNSLINEIWVSFFKFWTAFQCVVCEFTFFSLHLFLFLMLFKYDEELILLCNTKMSPPENVSLGCFVLQCVQWKLMWFSSIWMSVSWINGYVQNLRFMSVSFLCHDTVRWFYFLFSCRFDILVFLPFLYRDPWCTLHIVWPNVFVLCLRQWSHHPKQILRVSMWWTLLLWHTQ